MNEGEKRVLLGQLNSNGDCLYATTIAKQIKKDFPGCHLTWAIGSYCKDIINNNPYIDSTWVVPLENALNARPVWAKFREEAILRKNNGDFDDIFLVQLVNENYLNFNGTIRSSIFKSYPFPITVSIQPILSLRSEEIDKVKHFADKHILSSYRNVILFECSPMTYQASITPNIAYEIAEEVIKSNSDTCIILTSNTKIDSSHVNIIDGSLLTLRENAELTKYCTLLVGCSSGITWVATSDWAKKLPTIQTLNPKAIFFNSVVNDHERFGLSTDHITELPYCDSKTLTNCIQEYLKTDIQNIIKKYHKKSPIGTQTYKNLFFYFLKNKQYSNAYKFVYITTADQKSRSFALIFVQPLAQFLFLKLPRMTIRSLLRLDKSNSQNQEKK